METYIQTALGIVVSVILFLVGYRQTIGARKERVKAANASVHRALLRRMVLENYTPRYVDITRLSEGKASDFQVRSDDLISEEQILIQLYAEIFDNDLIPPELRKELEERLAIVFKEIEFGLTMEKPYSVQRSASPRWRTKMALVLGATASALGAIASFLTESIRGKGQADTSEILVATSVFIASLAIVTAITVLRRTRESFEEVSRDTNSFVSRELEKDVAKVLQKYGIHYTRPRSVGEQGADFLAEIGDKTVAIETRVWKSGPPPRNLLASVIEQLKEFQRKNGVDAALIVTSDGKKFPVDALNSSSVEIISLGDFPSYVEKMMTSVTSRTS